jgi:chromosome partitioning protein
LPTIAFVNPKGGAGKTTAALLLALGLAARGRKVAMVDADPNRPLVHWASLPDRPDTVSVHPAPMEMDLPDALREARAKADWVILDTEGSLRAGLAFATAKPDMVITPLASSPLEALQALKAAEMVQEAARKLRRPIIHACLFTRLPAAIRPRSLRSVVEMLKDKEIDILPTAIIEKEAFRTLFATGGDLGTLQRLGVHGAASAGENAAGFVDAVLALLEPAEADGEGQLHAAGS